MTFLRNTGAATVACLLLAACSGSDAPTAYNSENIVEKPEVTAESSPVTPAVAQPEVTETVIEATELAAEFANLPEPYKSADYARGRRTFKLCQSCHTLAEGGSNLVGPNLYGIFGQEIGGVEGFRYSKAVEEANFTWTPEQLEQWLENPRGFLPGNNMSFAGVRRPDDRHAVIAYIMVETGWEPSE